MIVNQTFEIQADYMFNFRKKSAQLNWNFELRSPIYELIFSF